MDGHKCWNGLGKLELENVVAAELCRKTEILGRRLSEAQSLKRDTPDVDSALLSLERGDVRSSEGGALHLGSIL